jgi:raffinose/stachyose/melibiose transport system permease protein
MAQLELSATADPDTALIGPKTPSSKILRRTRASARGASGRSNRAAYLYILPAFLVYAIFTIGPALHSILLSFTNWDGVTPGRWIGLANYQTVVSDPQVRSTFLHPLVLFIFYALIPIALGLGLTMILTRIRIRGLGTFRMLLFIPQVMAGVAIAVAWREIYLLNGPLNAVLRAVGLGGITRAWLGDFKFALPAVGLVGSWQTFGFMLILFVTGVQKIPGTLYEAARVDGAGPIREFFTVTVPGLRSEIVIAFVLATTAALQSFGLVYLLTNGGPDGATSVPAYAIYQEGFVLGHYGRAAAYGVVLTVLVMVVVNVITRFDRSRA